MFSIRDFQRPLCSHSIPYSVSMPLRHYVTIGHTNVSTSWAFSEFTDCCASQHSVSADGQSRLYFLSATGIGVEFRTKLFERVSFPCCLACNGYWYWRRVIAYLHRRCLFRVYFHAQLAGCPVQSVSLPGPRPPAYSWKDFINWSSFLSPVAVSARVSRLTLIARWRSIVV